MQGSAERLADVFCVERFVRMHPRMSRQRQENKYSDYAIRYAVAESINQSRLSIQQIYPVLIRCSFGSCRYTNKGELGGLPWATIWVCVGACIHIYMGGCIRYMHLLTCLLAT